jgi:DNA (cytosine-5)-methyltransferase 1
MANKSVADGGLRELALFAGAGGGILGGKLLGWRTICAVEYDAYAASVLVARQNDGLLPPFPIWDDVRTFDGRPWRGRVDVVSGGFPCQPFSTASRGRRVAQDLWPEMLRIITEVDPAWVFAENVAEAPMVTACRDLGRIGYISAHTAIAAAAVGAPHIRKRSWLAAYPNSRGKPRLPVNEEMACLCHLPGLDWRSDHSAALGMDDGMADRMVRLKAIGNGQVPLCAATAFRLLTE